jgi:uncharacterized protein
MKLHAQTSASLHTVTGYGEGYVEINAQRFAHSVLVMPERLLQPWRPGGFEELQASDFEALLAHNPAVVLLGTGQKQRFAHPRLTVALQTRHIGVEMMDSQAACRTYNILMAEGRQVLAAILL